ncbi:unnamed protein product [Vicia faba]|uniref:Uncharacterized protein n=1 Tax=Vicia faba TaxID=3906 RepID=A0AAV1AW85_VICFA|nr:unnamed protein product [Vicia faba]
MGMDQMRYRHSELDFFPKGNSFTRRPTSFSSDDLHHQNAIELASSQSAILVSDHLLNNFNLQSFNLHLSLVSIYLRRRNRFVFSYTVPCHSQLSLHLSSSYVRVSRMILEALLREGERELSQLEIGSAMIWLFGWLREHSAMASMKENGSDEKESEGQQFGNVGSNMKM